MGRTPGKFFLLHKDKEEKISNTIHWDKVRKITGKRWVIFEFENRNNYLKNHWSEFSRYCKSRAQAGYMIVDRYGNNVTIALNFRADEDASYCRLRFSK
jgi:hypothetical protein